MSAEILFIWLVIGGLAGWLSGQIMTRGGFGFPGSTFVGIAGAFVAGWLLPMIGLSTGGSLSGAIINATIGSMVLVAGLGLFLRGAALGADRARPRRSDSVPRSVPHQTPSPRSSISAALQPPVPHAPKQLFISYRRSDSLDVTGRIYDRLVRERGSDSVFRDLDSVPFGVDFRRQIEQILTRCDVCLVVMGPTWLTAPDGTGGRRIDDPKDHVRQEVEAALERNIRVVPILIGGAKIPSAEELPPSLEALAFRNGIHVRADPDFHRDMDRLLARLPRSA